MRKTLIKKILREGLNLQYKDLSTPELWFKDLLNNLDIYDRHPRYPNSIFFHINKEVYMEYDKNSKILYYSYDKIYSVLESKFGLNSTQINELVKGMVGEHYKLEVNTTQTSGIFRAHTVEEHYKLEVNTTISESGTHQIPWWRNIIN